MFGICFKTNIKNVTKFKLKGCEFKIGYRFYSSKSSLSSDTYTTSRKRKNYKKHDKPSLSYEEESDVYILKELQKVKLEYDNDNKQVDDVIKGFENALDIYNFKLLKAPLPIFTPKDQEVIHLKSTLDDATQFDILMDYKISPYKDTKEMQVIISNSENKPNQLVYLLGELSQTHGPLFSSCMVIDCGKIGKSVDEIRKAIACSENWIFLALNNTYSKELQTSNHDLLQFLNVPETENFPELEEELFIDAMINFTLRSQLGFNNNSDGMKLRSIFWMLTVYCENYAYSKWIDDLQMFIKS